MKIVKKLVKKIAAAVLAAGVCIAFIHGIAYTSPESITLEDQKRALKELDTPMDGTVIRVDVPDENGSYITLEGEEAQRWYDNAVEEAKQNLQEDITSLHNQQGRKN